MITVKLGCSHTFCVAELNFVVYCTIKDGCGGDTSRDAGTMDL